MTRICFLLCCVALSAVTLGQPFAAPVLSPSSPTERDLIEVAIRVLHFEVCSHSLTTNVSGAVVRTTIHEFGCVPGPSPPIVYRTTFGPLPPGTYSYEIYRTTDANPTPHLHFQQVLNVARAPAIPALTPPFICLMVFSLAVVGSVLSRSLQG